jgi:small-conductance mechanosensitive channel
MSMLCSITCLPSFTQNEEKKEPPAAVIVKGKRLFAVFTSHESLNPKQRVENASNILRQLASDPNFDVASIKTAESADGTSILAGDKLVVTVTNADAKAAGDRSSSQLARDYAAKIRLALAERIQETSSQSIAQGLAMSAGLTVLLVLCFAVIARSGSYLCQRVRNWEGVRLKGIRIQKAELLGPKSMTELVLSGIKLFQFILFVLLILCYSFQILLQFPTTQGTAKAIVANALVPLSDIGEEVLAYSPSLLVLLFIFVASYALVSFSAFFFSAVSDRSITLADFDPDWGEPTYKIVRFLIIALGMMIALPYVPGWESPAFKQIGLILGILISLGSTGAVSHVIAGTVLTYTNAFKIGERVRIGDVTGDVVEKTLFVTRLSTPKNEIVSIPNNNVLSAHITNYSHQGKRGNLILYTSVTIGYDVPSKQVDELLRSAAEECSYVLKEPAPFVLQTALNDFHVSYELNAFTNDAQRIPKTYSEIHEKIRDKFDAANVEIMSPHYTSLRDGNRITIPLDYLPKDYSPEGFKVEVKKV